MIQCFKWIAALCLVPLLHGQEPFFNGKDLSQWEIKGKAVWKVDNGEISGGQDGDPKRSGLLVTREDYQNFDLSFEFKIDEHGKYNSGVYFRFQPDQKVPRLQLNLGRGAADEPVGLYLDDWLDKGDLEDKIRRPNEWNHIRLRVEGSHVEVWLNQTKIVDFEDPARLKDHLMPGKIALQTYGAEGHSGWVKFRKLEIRKL